ncbi:PREDICTED: formin-like protein 9 [Brassica oleracea var. oleracea]|uniref:Formin-like protein n=1 Tax=Brassica oleracea var. oleracea TaxID=109376 RepID=A0A0D3DBR7_BRAOL|nr:PREDICTED: formin-like protein 9 [Brassica oleracea var. oleracea]
MQTFCFFSSVFFFPLLSCALSPLSYASSALNLGRRHLSDDAGSALLTPASPISPPFFPLESSAPPLPPPPPPPTFSAFPTTFPANISALVLPRSPKPHSASPALLVPAISAVLVVATVIGVALFLYGRWKGQNRHFKDTNTSLGSGSSSHSHGYDEEEPRHVITNNFSVSASSPTSEVLYLGGEEEPDRVVTSFVKPPESPEIRPLPPLPRSFQPSYDEAEVHDERNEDEEEEEFFSPLASLASSANSSPSRSGFEQCSSSSSSSGWVSPARSFSMTLSPVQQQRSFSRLSDVSLEQSLQSPSPERLRVRNSNGHVSSSLRMFSFFNQNLSFPRISSASTSPDRGGFVRTPLSSLYSSVSNSPDGLFRKFINSSPPIWNDFSRNVKSVLLSSESVSSRRDFVINIGDSSSRIWNQQSQAAAVAAPPPPTRPPPLVPPSQSFVVQNVERKPSFSDKLNQGSCQNTAWDCLKTNSFKLNKEIVETLFISNSSSPNINQRGLTYDLPSQNEVSYQNIATRLQLLNLTTKDVCNALLEGDSGALGAELLDCLSRLAPSKEEERKLRNASDDSAMIKLGPAERFLKELLQVPFVFKRVDALLSVANFYPEVEYVRRSFGVVQAACEELRNNKTFSRLLEAILKTGNKMSVGTNAHAFKFDTLLKLAEVKGLDGRSSVLHFVVQEMIKSEGSVKALDRIRNLSSEMETVKKSADIEYGVLSSGVLKLCQGIKNIKELLILSEESGCGGDQWVKFEAKMARFLETAGEEILKIKAQESSTLSALEEVTELFHGGSSKEEGQTLRVFMAVRDFLSTLDEVCNDMGDRFSA